MCYCKKNRVKKIELNKISIISRLFENFGDVHMHVYHVMFIQMYIENFIF